MTSYPEAMGWEFGDFEKTVSLDLTLGRASPAGELTVGDVGTVSIVKIVSLSPLVERLKVKKWINVSYLNNESRQCFVFRCIWLYNITTDSRLWKSGRSARKIVDSTKEREKGPTDSSLVSLGAYALLNK